MRSEVCSGCLCSERRLKQSHEWVAMLRNKHFFLLFFIIFIPIYSQTGWIWIKKGFLRRRSYDLKVTDSCPNTRWQCSELCKQGNIVLILIILEYPHWPLAICPSEFNISVLILIILEYPHWLKSAAAYCNNVYSLNPYYTGISSLTDCQRRRPSRSLS